jgi:DNA-binding CsgD family transcriptional regulator
VAGPVGRGREFERLRGALDAAGDAGQLATITGGPWIGKTHLLGALCDEAARRGWTVAHGRAVPRPGATSAPFELVVDALADHAERVGDPALVGLLATPPEALQHSALRAVRALLERLAGPSGLLLALDDVHLADQSTVELLDYLVRHPPAGPTLIALAYRPGGPGGPPDSVAAGGHVWRVELGPIGDGELNRLIPYRLDWSRRRLLRTASGGNPGVLVALADALLDERWAGADGSGAGTEEDLYSGVPPVVSEVFGRELRGLRAPAMLAAQAAAVCGDPFTPDLVAAVAECPEPAVRDAFDELVVANLVRPTGTWREFRFRDPVVRSVVYHSGRRGWLSAAHARAAGALADRGGGPVERACHVEQAAVAGDQASARVLVAAARQVCYRAPDRAGRWLRTSTLMSGRGAAADVSALLGVVKAAGGRLSEGSLLLAPATADDRLPPALGAEVAEWSARVYRLLGRYADARAVLGTGIAELPAEADRTGLHLELAALADDTADPDPEAPAVAAATGHADPLRRAQAWALIAAGRAAGGGVAAAAEPIRIAADLVAGADGGSAHRTEALYWLAEAERRSNLLAASIGHFRRALHGDGRAAHGHLCAPLSVGLGRALLAGGDLEGAAAAADHATDAAREAGAGPMVGAAHVLRGNAFAAAGDLPAAVRAVEVAIDDLAARRDRWASWADAVLGDVRDVLGEVRDSTVLAAGPVVEPAGPGQAALSTLSRREVEIARLVSEGCTNQQIASALRLSTKTVETYLSRIFKKLDICSRVQIAHQVGLAGGRLPLT